MNGDEAIRAASELPIGRHWCIHGCKGGSGSGIRLRGELTRIKSCRFVPIQAERVSCCSTTEMKLVVYSFVIIAAVFLTLLGVPEDAYTAYRSTCSSDRWRLFQSKQYARIHGDAAAADEYGVSPGCRD